MTPAEHRSEAENMLIWAGNLANGDPRAAETIAAAQVHATLALAPAVTPLPPAKPKPAQRVEVFDVELQHLAVYATDLGVVVSHPSSGWSTLLDDPAQVRLLADTLTAHADRMENR